VFPCLTAGIFRWAASSLIWEMMYKKRLTKIIKGKFMVHPDYQNRGIGTKLLEKIETYYKNKIFDFPMHSTRL
jgi:GNAT superfamily N-acetyltransferase